MRDQLVQRRRHHGRFLCCFERRAFAPRRTTVTSQPVLRQPHRDRRQPWIKRTLFVVVIQMRVGSDERILRDFFGTFWLTHHHHYKTEQPALIAAHQVPERVGVAPPNLTDDVTVRIAHAPGRSASSTRPNPIDAYTSFRPP